MDKNFDFLFVMRDIKLDGMTVTYSQTRLATRQIASLTKTKTLQLKINFILIPGRRRDALNVVRM